MSSDLNDLISQAEKSVAETAARRTRGDGPARTFLGPKIFTVVLTVVASYLGYAFWQYHAPPPKTQITRDLETIVDMTRQSIDGARAASGELPPAIPSASLAALVQYVPDAGKYRLSATLMGVRVTLEQDGSKSIDTNLPK